MSKSRTLVIYIYTCYLMHVKDGRPPTLGLGRESVSVGVGQMPGRGFGCGGRLEAAAARRWGSRTRPQARSTMSDCRSGMSHVTPLRNDGASVLGRRDARHVGEFQRSGRFDGPQG